MDEGSESLRPAPKGLLALGGIAGAVPFVISVSSWNNGTYRDWIAISGGAVAAVCGIVAVLLAVRAKASGGIIAGAALIAALGGYQLARGFGAFEAKGHSEVTIVRTMEPAPPPEAKPAPPPEDPIHAKQRVCDGGDATVCGDLGIAYLDGDGVGKDTSHGLALIVKGCDLGGKLACKNLGVIYREGKIVDGDAAKSFEYAVRACEKGQAPDVADAAAVGYSCDMAADMARAGQGTKKDPKRGAELGSEAVAFYRTACDAAAKHCLNLALSLQEGKNVKKDLPGAADLFGKACDAGNAGACNNLGDMLNRGEGVKKDKKAAKQLFDTACKAGVDVACNNLKAMK